GVPSSKIDGFDLSSGDFPTLGTEKNTESHDQQALNAHFAGAVKLHGCSICSSGATSSTLDFVELRMGLFFDAPGLNLLMGLEVINPDGGNFLEDDAKLCWRRYHLHGHTSVLIFEPMTMIRENGRDLADKSEDPYMRLVYASSWAISIYFAHEMGNFFNRIFFVEKFPQVKFAPYKNVDYIWNPIFFGKNEKNKRAYSVDVNEFDLVM
ncbi:hypothetical protein IFM89_015978, partial [Coptis chinensis]